MADLLGDHFTLVASDGQSFEVPRLAIAHSSTLTEVTELLEPRDHMIPLKALSGDILKVVVEYLRIHMYEEPEYRPYRRNPTPFLQNPLDRQLFTPLTAEQRTQLINAADYLNIPRLLDAVLGHVAALTKHLSASEMVKFLGISVQLTERQKALYRAKYPWFDL